MFSHMAWCLLSVRHSHLAFSASDWWLTLCLFSSQNSLCLVAPAWLPANHCFTKPIQVTNPNSVQEHYPTADWGDSLVFKILTTHVWRPEFNCWHPHKKPGIGLYTYKLMPGWVETGNNINKAQGTIVRVILCSLHICACTYKCTNTHENLIKKCDRY